MVGRRELIGNPRILLASRRRRLCGERISSLDPGCNAEFLTQLGPAPLYIKTLRRHINLNLKPMSASIFIFCFKNSITVKGWMRSMTVVLANFVMKSKMKKQTFMWQTEPKNRVVWRLSPRDF